jgi:hypothetical protein
LEWFPLCYGFLHISESQVREKSIVELQKYVIHLTLRSNLEEERQRATLCIWAADAEEAEQRAKELLKRGTILGFDANAWEIEWVEVKKGEL